MKKIKIVDIETLQQEKQRIKVLCKEKEIVLNKKLDYIQDNLGILALETILPINRKDKHQVNLKLDWVHGLINTFLPSIASKFDGSSKWVKIVEMAIAAIVMRFFGSNNK
jgi:hypothetical protein